MFICLRLLGSWASTTLINSPQIGALLSVTGMTVTSQRRRSMGDGTEGRVACQCMPWAPSHANGSTAVLVLLVLIATELHVS